MSEKQSLFLIVCYWDTNNFRWVYVLQVSNNIFYLQMHTGLILGEVAGFK